MNSIDTAIDTADDPAQDTSALPPGPGGPGILQSLKWLFRPEGYLTQLRERYGETFSVHIVTLGRFISFSNPAHVKQIFTAKPDVLHAGEGNQVLRPVVGENSLLTLDEDVHLRQRRLVLPAFHGERLKNFLGRIEELTDDEIDTWTPGEQFPLRDHTRDLALNVILEVIFGIRDRARKDEFRDKMVALDPAAYQKTVFFPVRLPLPASISPHKRFESGKAQLCSLIMDEVHMRREDPHADERDDVLSMLLQSRDEAGRPMTDQEILDELITLVVAGHETTSTALSWTFELMYSHPAVMRRATEAAKAGDTDYIDALVKESLRIRPAVSMAVRKVVKPVTIGGYDLTPGQYIGANLFLTHRRGDIYPDPLAFKPERFLAENAADTYSWYPFGGGTRRCIGASFAQFEMRTILMTILRRANLRSPDGKRERIVRRAVVTLAPHRDTRTHVVSVAPRVPAPDPAHRPLGAAA